MITRSEFADRYQQVLADRDAIEIDLQVHLARVFARQGRVVIARLAAIRASLVTDVPLTASAQFEQDIDGLHDAGFELLARQLANAGPAAASQLAADLAADPAAALRAESALSASGGTGAPAERSYGKPKPSGKPSRRRAAHIAPVTNAAHVPTSPIPPISSGEVFMGGFDDTLHQEMDGPIRNHTAAVGDALIGAGLFGTAAALHAYAESHVTALTDRLAYIGAETNGAVQTVLTTDAANGSTFEQMADHVGALFDRLAGAASAAISRVEGTAIIGGAASIAARIGQVDSDRMWVSQRDERVRDDHWDADGQIVALNEPFVVGDEKLDFPGDPSASPAQTANCRALAPGTLISAGSVVGMSRALVDEDVIHVTLASGKQLTASPEHPILTATGFRRADEIHEGDDLVGCDLRQRAGVSGPDVHDGPTPIEQVFDTLTLAAARRQGVDLAQVVLDRDPAHSEVEIVRADDLLTLGLHAPGAQHADEIDFALAHREVCLAGGSASGVGVREPDPVRSAYAAALHAVLSEDPSHDPASDAEFLRELEFACARPVSSDDLVGSCVQPVGHSGTPSRSGGLDPQRVGAHKTAANQLGAPIPVLDVGAVAGLLGVEPGRVQLDRVLDARRERWHGHVYDLQTERAWYVANGIVVHNCYVVFVPPGGDSAVDTGEEDDGSGDGLVAAAAWDPDLHPRGEHGQFGEGDVSPALTLHTGRLPKAKIDAWKATLGRASEGLDLHKPADRDTFRSRVAKTTATTKVGEVDKMTTLLGGTPPSRSTDPEKATDPNGRSGRALADAYMARDLQGHNLGTGFKIGGPQPGSVDEALARHAESVRQRNDTGPHQSVVHGRVPADMDSFPGLHASAAVLTDVEWASFAANAEKLIEWYDSGADGQIDWGAPGSFEDCVAIAGDHVDDPEAFCATRYHDATGEWPGAHHGAQ